MHVEDELELVRLHHREVTGLVAFEVAGGIIPALTKQIGKVGPKAHQTARIARIAPGNHRRNLVWCGKDGKLNSPGVIKGSGHDQESVNMLASKTCKSFIDFETAARGNDSNLNPQGLGRRFHTAQRGFGSDRLCGIDEHSNAFESRYHFN